MSNNINRLTAKVTYNQRGEMLDSVVHCFDSNDAKCFSALIQLIPNI